MRAIICGAGIAGLSLALRLADHDWDVVVLEKAPAPREQGYMIDFFGPGYDAAEEMGLVDRLTELGYHVEGASWFDAAGRERAALGYAQFENGAGGRVLSIMRPDLELALRERVAGRVEMRFGAEVTEVDSADDGVRVALADGTSLHGDLLVGADGVHSTVRRLVFGPERDYFRYLGFHTAAYVFEDPEVYRRLGNRFCLTHSTRRQLGLYRLRDGKVAMFGVHRREDPRLPADPAQEVREAYSTLGWVAPRALRHCPEPSRMYYDQVAQIEVPRWSSGRVVLVGDSCQAVSLVAGQGASLAVAGAYVLAEQLADADSITAALDRYERAWQPVAQEKQRVARNGVEWFLPSSRWRLWLRWAVLKLTGIPGVDRLFVTALAGKPTTVVEQLRAGEPARKR